MHSTFNVKFQMQQVKATLKFRDELHCIASAKELFAECEYKLKEKLSINITPKGIICFDNLDQTIFKLEYTHI